MYRYHDLLFKDKETAKKFYTKHLHKYYVDKKFNYWGEEADWLEENGYAVTSFSELSTEERAKAEQQFLDESFHYWEDAWLENMDEVCSIWDENNDDITEDQEELCFYLDEEEN